MTLPYLDQPNTLDDNTLMELDALVTKMNAFLRKEHALDGTHGAITADSLTIKGQTVAVGTWTTVPFNAANFTGRSTMVWTVRSTDVVTQSYTRTGHTLQYQLAITTTNVTAPVDTVLKVALPAGLKVTKFFQQLFLYSDAGANQAVGRVFGNIGDTFLSFAKFDVANWTATAGHNTSLYALATFEVTG